MSGEFFLESREDEFFHFLVSLSDQVHTTFLGDDTLLTIGSSVGNLVGLGQNAWC